MLNSFQTTTRPVASLLLFTPNKQQWKLKSSQFLLSSHGKTFSLVVRFCKLRVVIPFPITPFCVRIMPFLLSFLSTIEEGETVCWIMHWVCGPFYILEQPKMKRFF